jgi:hypothetical protein
MSLKGCHVCLQHYSHILGLFRLLKSLYNFLLDLQGVSICDSPVITFLRGEIEELTGDFLQFILWHLHDCGVHRRIFCMITASIAAFFSVLDLPESSTKIYSGISSL